MEYRLRWKTEYIRPCVNVSVKTMYVEKNCDIIQEFPFEQPEVKFKMDGIYNSSFPGSVLWDLSSKEKTSAKELSSRFR